MSRLYPESQWEWEQDWGRLHKSLAVRFRMDMETHLDLLGTAWDEACRSYNPLKKKSLAGWANLKLAMAMAERAGHGQGARFCIELNADGAPELAAGDEEEIESWRGEARRLGREVENLFNLLRLGGTAALAQAIGRCERRARQLIQEIEDAPERFRMRKLRKLARRVGQGPHGSGPGPRGGVQLQLEF